MCIFLFNVFYGIFHFTNIQLNFFLTRYPVSQKNYVCSAFAASTSTLRIHVCYLQHQLPESSTPAFSMVLFLSSCLRVYFQCNFKYIFLNVKAMNSVILFLMYFWALIALHTHTPCSHLYSFRIEFLALDNLSGSSFLRRLSLPL